MLALVLERKDNYNLSTSCNFSGFFSFRSVSPRLVVEPHAVYMRAYEGFDEININVTVKGGTPKPEVSDELYQLSVCVFSEV